MGMRASERTKDGEARRLRTPSCCRPSAALPHTAAHCCPLPTPPPTHLCSQVDVAQEQGRPVWAPHLLKGGGGVQPRVVASKALGRPRHNLHDHLALRARGRAAAARCGACLCVHGGACFCVQWGGPAHPPPSRSPASQRPHAPAPPLCVLVCARNLTSSGSGSTMPGMGMLSTMTMNSPEQGSTATPTPTCCALTAARRQALGGGGGKVWGQRERACVLGGGSVTRSRPTTVNAGLGAATAAAGAGVPRRCLALTSRGACQVAQAVLTRKARDGAQHIRGAAAQAAADVDDVISQGRLHRGGGAGSGTRGGRLSERAEARGAAG